DLGGDVSGAGLADAGAGRDQLIECEAMERLLTGRGGGDQRLPRAEAAVADQLQQFAAGSVGAAAVLDQPVPVGGVRQRVPPRGPRRQLGGRSIQWTERP